MKIGIVGMGVIGTSWGLALRKARSGPEARRTDIEVWGFDQDRRRLDYAKTNAGALDKAVDNLRDLAKDAGVIILCTPVMTLRDVMVNIGPHLPQGAIVTDAGSTKRAVMAWAKETLPANINFIGGHPMAGGVGLEHARADLFKGVSYILVPAENAENAAIDAISSMVGLAGGIVRFMDAAEHDSYVAAISHMPHVLASSLMNLVAGSEGWRDISKIAGNGFEQTTYGASGSPVVYTDICRSNADAIIGWIDRYQQELNDLKRMIQDSAETIPGSPTPPPANSEEAREAAADKLFDYLLQGQKARDAWLVQKAKPVNEDPDNPVVIPSKAEINAELRRSMFGNLLTRRPRPPRP